MGRLQPPHGIGRDIEDAVLPLGAGRVGGGGQQVAGKDRQRYQEETKNIERWGREVGQRGSDRCQRTCRQEKRKRNGESDQ